MRIIIPLLVFFAISCSNSPTPRPACTSNATCIGSTNTCTSGTCTCGANPACSGATPYCNAGTCAPCTASTQCTGAADTCTSSGTCVCGTSASATACPGTGIGLSCIAGSCYQALDPAHRHMFLTQYPAAPGTAYSPPGTPANPVYGYTFISVADADKVCQQSATAAGWQPAVWAAVIAGPTLSALAHIQSRVTNDTLPIYALPIQQQADQTFLANNVAALNSTGIANQNYPTEAGRTGNGSFWTGASTLSSLATAGNDCNGWTSNSSSNNGLAGVRENTGTNWFTPFVAQPTQPCSINNTLSGDNVSIICIQVDL